MTVSTCSPFAAGTVAEKNQTCETVVQSMKRILLKLVAVFEIVSGLVGMYAVTVSLLGTAPPELAPMLWFGTFPLASVYAGIVLWRGSKLAIGVSLVVQALQIPVVIT